MTNPNDPAFPDPEPYFDQRYPNSTNGLTKREYFAGLIMQGFCADPDNAWTAMESANAAVRWAECLIAELSKETK